MTDSAPPADLVVNPVLRGFHPDPSVVRDGDRWILATSTFEWFPGIALHASTDLVTWTPIGHVVTDPDVPGLSGVPDSCGIWAPSIDERDGEFRVVFSVVRSAAPSPYRDVETFVATAPRPEGPWSTPRYLNSAGFDPSLFTDDDGVDHLLTIRWDHRPGRPHFAGIESTPVDVARGQLTGPTRLLLTHDTLIEGPNVYPHGDGWLMLLAEGGTGFNHGIRAAYAERPEGPWTLDPEPLLTARDDPASPLGKAGHGELTTGPDGDTYLFYLASRPVRTFERPHCPLGRETCLDRVEVVDGRLRLAGGGHAPRERIARPAVTAAEPAVPTTPSTGPGTAPDPEWVTLRDPLDPSWADLSAWPERVRLRGRHGPMSLYGRSMLARRFTELHQTVTTTVDATPDDPLRMAGLAVYYGTLAHCFLHLTHDEHRGRVLVLTVQDEARTDRQVLREVPGDGPVRMRAELAGAELRFAAAAGDEPFAPAGPALPTHHLSDDGGSLLRFTGLFAGVAAHDLRDHTMWAGFTLPEFTLPESAPPESAPPEPGAAGPGE